MQGLRLSDRVVSVTLLQQSSTGEITPVVLYETRKSKKRKSSRFLGVLEKIVEEVMDAQKTATDSHRRRFKESSRKKRDGWLMDMPTNVFKAVRDGVRGLSLEKVV